MKTENIIKGSKKLKVMFGFSTLDEKHDLFSNKNKKIFGKFKNETPRNISIDEFAGLTREMCSFKCGNIIENKLKGFSKSIPNKAY